MFWELFRDYLLQNWSLILVLSAFAIALYITVFLDIKEIHRLYILIIEVFLLSIVVFLEFGYAQTIEHRFLRSVLIAIRYSATPLIIAQLLYALVKRQNAFIFTPAIVFTVINFLSIYNGYVFSIGEDNVFRRGVLSFFPYFGVGLYSVALVYLLIKRSNKKSMEIIPIIFLSIALLSGLVFPFVFGNDFAQIFCSTIAIALFIYYVFEVLQQTKKDSLTGLLNRQAYNSDITVKPEEINALVLIDMNGLKYQNDNFGHTAGDEALLTLGLCFHKALRMNQYAYRIGGDEFTIICRKTSKEALDELIKRIEDNVKETKYTCSIGYSYSSDGEKGIDKMLKEADVMMYEEKERYYIESGRNRRKS